MMATILDILMAVLVCASAVLFIAIIIGVILAAVSERK